MNFCESLQAARPGPEQCLWLFQAAPGQAVTQNFLFFHGPPAPRGSSASYTCPLQVFPAVHPSFLTGPSTASIPRGDQLSVIWGPVRIFDGTFPCAGV